MAAEALSASTTTCESKRRFDERIRLMLGSSSTTSTLPIYGSLSNIVIGRIRQRHRKCYATIMVAAHPHVAAVCSCDASGNRQSQARSGWLGCEEGLEDPFQVRSRYRRPGILNIDAEHLSIIRRCQGYCAIFRRRIDGVERQVQEGPFYERSVYLGRKLGSHN